MPHIEERFKSIGLTPLSGNSYRQPFEVTDSYYFDATLRFEQKLKPANIIGVKKGDSDSFILVVAHYDHLKPNKEAGLIYPGANDNASGVAMMLRLAGNFSAIQTSSTLIFIAFGAEEMGCKGSEYFVENLPMDKDKITYLIPPLAPDLIQA